MENNNEVQETIKTKEYLRNIKQEGEALELLQSLADKSVKLVFLDPQYEDVGDISRSNSLAPLNNQTEYQIINIIKEIERVLVPQGFLLLWVNKKFLGNDKVSLWLNQARKLKVVDFLVWDKGFFGFGNYFRSQCEYAFLIQKKPTSGKKFKNLSFANIWKEKITQWKEKNHPHQKPYFLIRSLIEAMSEEGDLVVDPCAGSFVVLDACEIMGREFIGCDLTLQDLKEYHEERERDRNKN